MKKISVIYWSLSGHVKDMAIAVAKGIEENGGKAKLIEVDNAKIEDVINADGIAFGSPSMDNNRIDQSHMQPFISKFKGIDVKDKKIVLFGSFGWDHGEFMEKWIKEMKDYDFDIIGSFCIKEAPNNQDLKECEALGAKLAK